ncbi:SseB family protein, partial [Caulobacter sp. 17J65-9]|uniref:SseB family protein n=1 Tax=Caulobacter sp. 17J65-9 TaxID=2709382 RepID=UPI0013C89ECD
PAAAPAPAPTPEDAVADARAAIAKGDLRPRELKAGLSEAQRRYALAYNKTILLERPFIAPANELEQRLVAMARNPSEASERAFGELLLTSKVYLVTNKEGYAAAKAGSTDVSFWTAPLRAGTDALALFTSEQRVREAMANDGEIYMLAMPGRSALELAGGVPIAVNYGLQPPAIVQPEQVALLLERSTAGR